jgi:hypothetical protein
MMASEEDIKSNRKGYKVGMYFTIPIIILIIIWSLISEIRWVLFSTPFGSLAYFDTWMLFGVIGMVVALGWSFFTFGQYSSKMVKECSLLGGALHLEERQIIMLWAIIIGMILGMGFWDIVTEIHLAIEYGILNIWFIDVIVFDFGFWQMIIPVWGLVIIGVLKMGAVIILYALSIKNISRGTVCELAGFKKDAILG